MLAVTSAPIVGHRRHLQAKKRGVREFRLLRFLRCAPERVARVVCRPPLPGTTLSSTTGTARPIVRTIFAKEHVHQTSVAWRMMASPGHVLPLWISISNCMPNSWLADDGARLLAVLSDGTAQSLSLRCATLAPINHCPHPKRDFVGPHGRLSAHIALATTRVVIAHVLHAHKCG